jgi:hypothetical protein
LGIRFKPTIQFGFSVFENFGFPDSANRSVLKKSKTDMFGFGFLFDFSVLTEKTEFIQLYSSRHNMTDSNKENYTSSQIYYSSIPHLHSSTCTSQLTSSQITTSSAVQFITYSNHIALWQHMLTCTSPVHKLHSSKCTSHIQYTDTLVQRSNHKYINKMASV